MRKAFEDQCVEWARENVFRSHSLPESTLRRVINDAWEQTYWIGIAVAVAGAVLGYFVPRWLERSLVGETWFLYVAGLAVLLAAGLLGNHLATLALRRRIEQLVSSTERKPSLKSGSDHR